MDTEKHPFNNCAAWAKGWYQMRPNVHSWWMDLSHCIGNDGWCETFTKDETVRWIFNQFDCNRDWFKKANWQFGFYDMHNFIKKQQLIFYPDEELTYEDGVILYYKHLLSLMRREHFDGGVRPSPKVLPLYYHSAYYHSAYKYGDSPSYTPAEMASDVYARINESFGDLDDQDISEYGSFEYIEASMYKTDYKDVVIPLGSDCLHEDEKLTITTGGAYLNNKESVYIGKYNKYGDKLFADLGLFKHSKGFDENKEYQLTIKVSQDDWGWDDYTVVNIIEL